MPPGFDLNIAASARIVVAMSGGVDSSVVAALAAKTGAEVIGVTLQLYDHGEAVKRSGSCCAGQDIYDAKTVCDRLGIAHYVLDYESRFRTGVIDKFADEYAAGRTPVPCSLCNQGVKFVDLIAFARELGADCLATGHYVRRVLNQGRVEMWKGRDPARDQSYFLYGTTADQLDYLRFPLGDLPKSEVRRLAGEAGLIVADKPDSQDICFVPDGDYAGLVKKLRPETAAPGEIVALDGTGPVRRLLRRRPPARRRHHRRDGGGAVGRSGGCLDSSARWIKADIRRGAKASPHDGRIRAASEKVNLILSQSVPSPHRYQRFVASLRDDDSVP